MHQFFKPNLSEKKLATSGVLKCVVCKLNIERQAYYQLVVSSRIWAYSGTNRHYKTVLVHCAHSTCADDLDLWEIF